MKVRDAIKMIEAEGWVYKTTKGSHHQFVHPTRPGWVTIPGTSSKELAPGTLNSILKQAGIKK